MEKLFFLQEQLFFRFLSETISPLNKKDYFSTDYKSKI